VGGASFRWEQKEGDGAGQWEMGCAATGPERGRRIGLRERVRLGGGGRADAARGTSEGREARGADPSQGSGGWAADSHDSGKSRNKFLSPLRTF
jgi:hypothetical protein